MIGQGRAHEVIAAWIRYFKRYSSEGGCRQWVYQAVQARLDDYGVLATLSTHQEAKVRSNHRLVTLGKKLGTNSLNSEAVKRQKKCWGFKVLFDKKAGPDGETYPCPPAESGQWAKLDVGPFLDDDTKRDMKRTGGTVFLIRFESQPDPRDIIWRMSHELTYAAKARYMTKEELLQVFTQAVEDGIYGANQCGDTCPPAPRRNQVATSDPGTEEMFNRDRDVLKEAVEGDAGNVI